MNLPLGNPIIVTPIIVTDTSQKLTVPHGIIAVELCNMGNSDCYFGDINVTSANGIPIFSAGVSKIWEGIPSNFQVWLVCTTGQTTTLRRVNYV
jgi:hypothetical protein